MTKKHILYILMLAIVVLAASCHKDDDKPTEQKIENPGNIDTGDKEYIGDGIIDNMPDEQRLPIRYQFAVAAILYNLAGLVDVPDNFAQNTYEPVYGSVISGSSPSVRTVVVKTADDAEDDFCSLVGSQAELLKTTPDGLVLSIKNVQATDGSTIDLGTLTFHRSSDGNAIGYVEVDIPCIPHLERIDYIPPTALPNNAGINTPYLLGDIVRVNDNFAPENGPGYYLCVKPNNETAGVLVNLTIEHGAWNQYYINADDDNDGCWYPYNKTMGEYVQKSDVEAYINFIAQNPDKVKNIKAFLNGKGASAYQPTLKNRLYEIFPHMFAAEKDGSVVAYYSDDTKTPAAIRYNASCSGLWRTTYWYEVPHKCNEGWKVSTGKSFEYFYSSTYKAHMYQYHGFCINVIHFGTKEIHGAMKEFSPINDKFITKEEEDSMIEYITVEKVGWCYADDNRLYKTAADAIAANHKPLGIVAYVSDGTEYCDQITQGRGHGLVMAYKNAKKDPFKWNPDGESIMELDPDDAYTQYVTNLETALNDFDGESKTDFMYGNNLQAATAAIKYTPKAPKYSTWFVPTTAQWMAILGERGLGRLNSKNFGWDNGAVLEPDGQRSTSLGSINDYLLTSAGSSVEYDAFDDATGYMSCSAADATANYILLFNANDTITAKLQPVDSDFEAAHVRPVFAF